MPRFEFVWLEREDGNVHHLGEHGVAPAEAEHVVQNPVAVERSESSGRPIAFGYTPAGRKLAVVYELLDRITV